MNVILLMQTFININEFEAMYYSLVKEFVKNGHNVTVVASNEGREHTYLCKEGVADVLRVKTLPLLNINPILKGISNLLLSPLYKRAIRKYLRTQRFDLIVHSDTSHYIDKSCSKIEKTLPSQIVFNSKRYFSTECS